MNYTKPTSKKKVLLVDDSISFRDKMRIAFANDYEMVCVANPVLGIQKCKEQDFDLILLDWYYHIDGEYLSFDDDKKGKMWLLEFKSISFDKKIPLIIITIDGRHLQAHKKSVGISKVLSKESYGRKTWIAHFSKVEKNINLSWLHKRLAEERKIIVVGDNTKNNYETIVNNLKYIKLESLKHDIDNALDELGDIINSNTPNLFPDKIANGYTNSIILYQAQNKKINNSIERLIRTSDEIDRQSSILLERILALIDGMLDFIKGLSKKK